MHKINTDIIISINVHEKVTFLLQQIKNIQQYVSDYIIILNCNNYMHNELKNIKLPSNVIINNDIINKNRYTGKLTQGIYSNIKYAIEHFNFKYFIVLSSRNLFYNNLNIDALNKTNKITSNINEIIKINRNNKNYNIWHWPIFLNTDLAKYYIKKGLDLHNSCHEGLVFHYHVCENILNFLEKNTHIKNNLFNFGHCVEEFALQTISTYEINIDNLHYGFSCINRTVETDYIIPTDPNWFVYKTIRT